MFAVLWLGIVQQPEHAALPKTPYSLYGMLELGALSLTSKKTTEI